MLGKAEGELRRRAGEMDCREVICCSCGKVLKCSCCALWSLMLVAVCGKWVVRVSDQRQCCFNLLIVFLCLRTTKPVWCNDRMMTQNNLPWLKKKKESSFYLRVTNKFVASLRIIMVKIRLFNFTMRPACWGQNLPGTDLGQFIWWENKSTWLSLFLLFCVVNLR